jgi:ABC-type multidrug transport system ATPase subunit
MSGDGGKGQTDGKAARAKGGGAIAATGGGAIAATGVGATAGGAPSAAAETPKRPVARGRETVLRAQGLGRSYDGYVALGSFSVEVKAGEFVALIGPNGAGKTTFLNLAAGLLDPTAGQVEVAGETPGSLAARTALSFLPDSPVFYEDLSVVEHLEYVAALHAAEDTAARIDELIDRLGLEGWEDALGSELSKGMRQKVSIALALVRPFKVLLADEPLDGLDPPSRETLFAMLAETKAAGAAIVVSTHRPDVIAAADRCVAIRDGRLAYDGPPDPEVLTQLFDRSELEGS